VSPAGATHILEGMSTPSRNGDQEPAPRKPSLEDWEPIEYESEDVGYGRLLMWPVALIGALLLLAWFISSLDFVGSY